jgi:transcriptional regulator with AAA-type ATPase domain
MTFLTPRERALAAAISRIVYVNPFLPERIAKEREALGDEFDEKDSDWNVRAESEGQHPNIERLTERAGALAEEARARLASGVRRSAAEIRLYEDVVLFFLYHSHYAELRGILEEAGGEPRGGTGRRIAFYPRFRKELERFLGLPGLRGLSEEETAHLFACFFQIRRAFHHIFQFIIGSSPPAVRLRAAAWQSIFTHDLERYRRGLFAHMGDFTTLITGPSGTGKELVARAIALSRYVPFDPSTGTFAGDFVQCFHPVSLSALSATLIESEIFGHRRGSFTGALEDHAGRLEVCSPLGTVFLDEVGEIDGLIQVKLLRVLQTRTFERIGDTKTLQFQGKIIAATNRDLAREIREGRFRTDLYYRLCSDMVETPSLHEQLARAPDELHRLTRFIARRVAGEASDALAEEVVSWIERQLGRDYAWPGNFRELEQCVRNVLIRGEYRPPQQGLPRGRDRISRAFLEGELSAEELLAQYCTLVYAIEGSYEGTARRLGLDRRTVRKKVDPGLLDELRGGQGNPG